MSSQLVIILTTLLIVPCVGGADFITSPGDIPNSYKLENKTWVCPLVKDADSEGDIEKVQLKVQACPMSSYDSRKCPSYMDPVYFELRKGDKPTIVRRGWESHYNTSQLAQFFGNKVCLSYPYFTYYSDREPIVVECRHTCFRTTFGPELTDAGVSRLTGGYAGNGYWYDVTLSSSVRGIPVVWLLVLLISLSSYINC